MAEETAVTVEVSPEIKNGVSKLEQWAVTLTIRTAEERFAAVQRARECKAGKAAVIEFFRESKTKADQAHKAICAAEKRFTDKFDYIERRVKDEANRFDKEQETIREKERARLQAIADEKARKERERLEKEAEKLKTPELKEARLEEAAAIVAPVVQVAEPEKAKGEATKLFWKARLVDKGALIAAAANGNDLAATLLSFDQYAANKTASATKGNVTLSGVEFYSLRNLAIGKG